MKRLPIVVNGHTLEVRHGTSVAVALLNAGVAGFRSAADGGSRGPLCAMGICYECRVEIDGFTNRRACMEICRPEMVVKTGG